MKQNQTFWWKSNFPIHLSRINVTLCAAAEEDLYKTVFEFTYGYCTHFLYKFCLNIAESEDVADTVKKCSYVYKAGRPEQLLWKPFLIGIPLF